jgi:hypothetical protein
MPPAPRKQSYRPEVVALSRTRYAKPRRIVEQEILSRRPIPQNNVIQRRLI